MFAKKNRVCPKTPVRLCPYRSFHMSKCSKSSKCPNVRELKLGFIVLWHHFYFFIKSTLNCGGFFIRTFKKCPNSTILGGFLVVNFRVTNIQIWASVNDCATLNRSTLATEPNFNKQRKYIAIKGAKKIQFIWNNHSE